MGLRARMPIRGRCGTLAPRGRGSVTVHDDDRDPLADARATVRAMQAAGDWREVLALAESLDADEARLALVALGIDALAMRGALERPDDEPNRQAELPDDPFEDADWLAQGRTTLAALAELSPLAMYRGIHALSEPQLRAAITHAVLDELVRRELARHDREEPDGG